MASETLNHIMNNWTAKFPPNDEGFLELPFNIENFCRENDEKLDALKREVLAARDIFDGNSQQLEHNCHKPILEDYKAVRKQNEENGI